MSDLDHAEMMLSVETLECDLDRNTLVDDVSELLCHVESLLGRPRS